MNAVFMCSLVLLTSGVTLTVIQASIRCVNWVCLSEFASVCKCCGNIKGRFAGRVAWIRLSLKYMSQTAAARLMWPWQHKTLASGTPIRFLKNDKALEVVKLPLLG